MSVEDLDFEEKFTSALDVVALLQEFSTSSHIPGCYKGTFGGLAALPVLCFLVQPPRPRLRDSEGLGELVWTSRYRWVLSPI